MPEPPFAARHRLGRTDAYQADDRLVYLQSHAPFAFHIPFFAGYEIQKTFPTSPHGLCFPQKDFAGSAEAPLSNHETILSPFACEYPFLSAGFSLDKVFEFRIKVIMSYFSQFHFHLTCRKVRPFLPAGTDLSRHPASLFRIETTLPLPR